MMFDLYINLDYCALDTALVITSSPSFIRLEARLQPNIGFAFWRILVVFTCSAIIPPNDRK